MKIELSFTVNGTEVKTAAAPGERLIDLLREQLHLTGTKEGCGEGECGACSVLVDSKLVNACLFPALEAEGRAIVTIEGLIEKPSRLSAVQRAFVEGAGVQCGFCTPGMVMSTTALLMRSPDPSDPEIVEALAGNLCRCTGYVQIIESVRRAVELSEAPTSSSEEEEAR